MKYIFRLTGVLLIFVIVYFFYWRKVEFVFLEKIEINTGNIDHNYEFGILSDKQALESCLKLMPLKLYYEQGLILKDKFDFEKEDYIISYGKKIKELKYNWYYALFVDRYYSLLNDSKIPVKAVYENDKWQMAIYIYKLPKKKKYRGVI